MISKFFSVAALALLSANAIAQNTVTDETNQWETYSIEIPADGKERATSGYMPDYASSYTGYNTQVLFENKGGYEAKAIVEFIHTKNGKKEVVHAESPWIFAGNTIGFTVPNNATNLKVTTSRKTGLVWSPVRNIVSKNICSFNNQWTDYSKGLNIVKLDVWGTTLQPKWKFMQYKGAIDNGTDTSQPCANY